MKSDHHTTIGGGLPCIARVTHYFKQPPNPRADSDWDYAGYEEIEFDLLTTRGKPAPFLEKLMSDSDRERIETELLEEI